MRELSPQHSLLSPNCYDDVASGTNGNLPPPLSPLRRSPLVAGRRRLRDFRWRHPYPKHRVDQRREGDQTAEAGPLAERQRLKPLASQTAGASHQIDRILQREGPPTQKFHHLSARPLRRQPTRDV